MFRDVAFGGCLGEAGLRTLLALLVAVTLACGVAVGLTVSWLPAHASAGY